MAATPPHNQTPGTEAAPRISKIVWQPCSTLQSWSSQGQIDQSAQPTGSAKSLRPRPECCVALNTCCCLPTASCEHHCSGMPTALRRCCCAAGASSGSAGKRALEAPICASVGFEQAYLHLKLNYNVSQALLAAIVQLANAESRQETRSCRQNGLDASVSVVHPVYMLSGCRRAAGAAARRGPGAEEGPAFFVKSHLGLCSTRQQPNMALT